MIKKIQIELAVFTLLFVSLFLTQKIDEGIYSYFSQFDYGPGSDYLKDFFIGITSLGNSLWYFLIFFLIFAISFLAKKLNLVSLKSYTNLKHFSIFSFFYLFLVGTITQIIKHLIGRPRPNHTTFNSDFDFNFFTTDSSFHSFPSGHSSTIIAVILILSLVFPKLRGFFYIFGLLIAFSRVVVGAHFITDVVAGIFLGSVVQKINFTCSGGSSRFFKRELTADVESICTSSNI